MESRRVLLGSAALQLPPTACARVWRARGKTEGWKTMRRFLSGFLRSVALLCWAQGAPGCRRGGSDLIRVTVDNWPSVCSLSAAASWGGLARPPSLCSVSAVLNPRSEAGRAQH